MKKKIFLYGLAGAREMYRCVRYWWIETENLSIRDILYEAALLKERYPSIEAVYAIDNRRGLRHDYMDSIQQNSIESCAIFKDILEREGIRI